jgi:hypothetical protein
MALSETDDPFEASTASTTRSNGIVTTDGAEIQAGIADTDPSEDCD